ncbi:MAG: hypothetical protein ACYDIC_01625 [Desulfobaccales bacterium]
MSTFSQLQWGGGFKGAGLKVLSFFVMLCLFLALQAQSGGCQVDAAAGKPLTPQEKWVLDQVKQGSDADLKAKFGPDPVMLRLSAGFLTKLLVKGFDSSSCPQYQGIQISHAVIDDPLDLKNAEINYYTRLSQCLFKQEINCRNAYFKKPLNLSGSRFCAPVSFEEMKVDGDVNYNDTVFEKEVEWTAAIIGGKFYAKRAEFCSEEKDTIFNGMKVNYTIFLTGAKFHGPVNFVVASTGRHLMVDGATFLSPQGFANFKSIKVGWGVNLNKSEFHGPLSFLSAEVNEEFRVQETKLLNNKAVNFSNLKVGQKFFFEPEVIRSDINMSYGNYYDLEIGVSKDDQGNCTKLIDIPSIYLEGAVVQRNLTLNCVNLSQLYASYLQVKGRAYFNQVAIKSSAVFSNSSFQNLIFEKVKWPEIDKKTGIRQVDIGELTYNRISIDKPDNKDYQQEDFEKIKGFVDASPFNTQSYIQVESFFKRIGKETWANQIFMHMHNRELAETKHWADPSRWLEWFFWGALAGYGRAPFRVFFVSLALIIIGAYLYDPLYLKQGKFSINGKISRSIVIRVLLSLDRFLPVELGLGKNWDHESRNFLIWFFYYLEMILGWILIPIALASIYSQLK